MVFGGYAMMSLSERTGYMLTCDTIDHLDKKLTADFSNILEVNGDLDRRLVSFQANKTASEYRWCKYKEGFSSKLINYIFDTISMPNGPILDPFAGAGTTMFVASDRGKPSAGIELLPHSASIIQTRMNLRKCNNQIDIIQGLRDFASERSWTQKGKTIPFQHLRITKGAFSAETQRSLERFRWEVQTLNDDLMRQVLQFACMCVLEKISFTRKDGQYLRWDHRSGRSVRKTAFDKGKIFGFNDAVVDKINEIAFDLESPDNDLFDLPETVAKGSIDLFEGSCLSVLPKLRARSFSGLITSPPYCNRYDYTRTYALELAYLGVGEDALKHLRQTMLTCTVENRFKDDLEAVSGSKKYSDAMNAWQEQELLANIIGFLEQAKVAGELNNSGIPRMVSGYFREMALAIFEFERILKPGAPLVMVNDNVRFHGIHIPVDLILSDIASKAGFDIEKIWVLPKGKGNSSQQMGEHGRSELRKCVYIWKKPSKVPQAKKPMRQVALSM